MTTTVPPRRRALAAALAATALALSACGTTQPESTVLEQHGLAGMDAPEIIEPSTRWPSPTGRPRSSRPSSRLS